MSARHLLVSALLVTAAPAMAAINVDIPAGNGAGTTVNLAAGTYKGSFVSGGFQAWNPFSAVSDCDAGGANCGQGWVVSLQVDLGGAGGFDRTNGFGYYFPRSAGDNYPRFFSTAAAAVADAQTAPLYQSPLATYGVPSSYIPSTGIGFTLAAPQAVNFFIGDSFYGDNLGGVSVSLAAVPEPATWAMLIVGMGGVGGALRRRTRTSVRFA